MKMELASSEPFNLETTLCCGQAFRWSKQDEWWYGVVGSEVFKIRQTDTVLEFENVAAGFIETYFGLNDNLPRIFSIIRKDHYIGKAIQSFTGLRILRQDPWECLVSYICATYISIASVKQMLLQLSQRFGAKVRFDGHDFYTFPSPDKLAKASCDELASCHVGFRAKYIRETARIVQANPSELERLKKVNYTKARTRLLDYPGVGMKVADCVLLFSLEKLDAFPVDVWIKRAMTEHYTSFFSEELLKKVMAKKSLTCAEYERLNQVGREYFGEYAGYAQEYLYHYIRMQR